MTSLTDLPPELLDIICGETTNSDRCTLMRTCRLLHSIAIPSAYFRVDTDINRAPCLLRTLISHPDRAKLIHQISCWNPSLDTEPMSQTTLRRWREALSNESTLQPLFLQSKSRSPTVLLFERPDLYTKNLPTWWTFMLWLILPRLEYLECSHAWPVRALAPIPQGTPKPLSFSSVKHVSLGIDLEDEPIKPIFTIDHVYQFLQWPSLEELDIRGITSNSRCRLKNFVKHSSSVERLSLYNTILLEDEGMRMLALPKALREFTLYFEFEELGAQHFQAEALGNALTANGSETLESLQIFGLAILDENQWLGSLRDFKVLEELTVIADMVLGLKPPLISILPESLKSLSILYCRTHRHKLEAINDLVRCKHVSGRLANLATIELDYHVIEDEDEPALEAQSQLPGLLWDCAIAKVRLIIDGIPTRGGASTSGSVFGADSKKA